MKHFRSRMLLVLTTAFMPLLVASAATPQKTTPAVRPQYKTPLDPDDIKAIQNVGQAVLSIRQGYAPDAAQETMRQQIKDFGAELDHAFNAPPTFHIGKRTEKVQELSRPATLIDQPRAYRIAALLPDGSTLPAEDIPSPLPLAAVASTAQRSLPAKAAQISSDHFAAVRARLKMINQNNNAVMATIQSDSVQGAFTRHLHDKTMALYNEIDSALTKAAADDLTQIAKLRDRLRPKTLNQVMSERAAVAVREGERQPTPVPSITTITRHR